MIFVYYTGRIYWEYINLLLIDKVVVKVHCTRKRDKNRTEI